MPQKRTVAVLASLVAGMTVVSGLLMLLQPTPIAPPGVPFSSLERGEGPSQRMLFDFERAGSERTWKSIVIHDSRGAKGDLADLDAARRQGGEPDSGYHFVVNDGSGQADGVIEASHRWDKQHDGAYLRGKGNQWEWYHRNAIGVCLMGDANQGPVTDAQLRELAWLIRQLQNRYNIPAEQVFVRVGSAAQQPAPHFPQAWLRSNTLP